MGGKQIWLGKNFDVMKNFEANKPAKIVNWT